jgi:branched-chain amino acid transport system ATP-binding protein
VTTPLLEMIGVEKHFGGLIALHDLHLRIEAGSITGLIGPNGAGKTTLFNILTGHYSPDAGEIRLRGEVLKTHAPYRICEQGIARTFQNIRLFHSMTALENVMVGRHARTHTGLFGAIFKTSPSMKEEREIRDSSLALLEFVGIAEHQHRVARTLSYGDQRRLEIARALATDPILLALDEPAAGMNDTETQDLGKLLRRIRDKGVTLLLIEHDMGLVMGLSDHVAVLDYGRLIASGPPREVQSHPRVIEAYLGAEVDA